MRTYKQVGGVIILVILLLTVFLGYRASQIKFNYDIESFFSKSNKELTFYLDFREAFENDNDFILIGISNRNGVFQKEFLSDLDSLTVELKAFERFKSVTSPTNLKNRIPAPLGGLFKVPVVHVDDPERYESDIAKIYGTNDYISAFFSPDTHAVSFFIKKEEFTTKEVNDSILGELGNLLDGYNFDEYHIAGRIRTQNYYVNRMGSEMILFAAIALVLLIGFLLMIFRCFVGIFVPIIVLLISVMWTLAFIELTGGELDLMMTMLPTLLFVIGISNSVHIITKYIDELGTGSDKITALKVTLREVGLATFLTSLTTAAGFLTLVTIDIEPIQKFGFYAAVGVLLTYLVSILLLPAVLVNIKPHFISCSIEFKPWWDQFLKAMLGWSIKKYRAIFTTTVLFIVLAIVGISQIRVNNHFLDDLQDDSSLKNDLAYFERNFAGIRPFELGIDLNDTSSSIFSMEVLKDIERVENYLKAEYGIGFIYSPATIVKTAHRATNGGAASQYKLPESEQKLKLLMQKLSRYRALSSLKHLVTENKKRGRIAGKMKDLGSAKVAQLNKNLMKYTKDNTEHVRFTITGAAQLMDNTNANIALNLLKGLSIAIALIAIIIYLLFGSFKVALLSLLPNILPMVLIGGIMGILHIELKVATALIFTIAFGIAVDDTIHFLSKLKIELKKGSSLDDALTTTYLTTGKAIIYTSIILSAGFLSFLLSDFQSTFSIGLLLSITLFIAVLSDLLLLPVLLKRIYKH